MATDARLRVGGPTASYGFGLEIEAPFDLELVALKQPARPSGKVVIHRADPDELEGRWPDRDTTVIMERRRPSGQRFLVIEHHGQAGYRVHAPDYGSYLVSSDGRSVLAALPDRGGWQWQRLFFAQVLPLAAALQGLAAFHASAVVVDGGMYGFVAPSGTGKTSLTAQLVTMGATFMTDDVLVLNEDGGRVLGHPGASMLALQQDEVAMLTSPGRARLGREVGTDVKTYFAPPAATAAAPLYALFYLSRDPSISAFGAEPRPADPRILLSGAFLAYLDAPEHLQAHLDVCAQIAESVPVYDVKVPPDHGSRNVAEQVLELISSRGAPAA